jgi:hypothetical protein
VNAASQLGKMAAGVPKKYSPAEIAKRTARLRKAQKNRAKTQRALRRSNNAICETRADKPLKDK